VDMSIQSCWDIPDGVDDASGSASDGEPDSAFPRDQGAVLRDCLTANYDRLHRRLLRYFGCPDQASDSLHDAWLRLGDMEMPATVSYPEAYIYRMACNLALDRIRNSRSCQSLADINDFEALVDPLPGPDQIAEARSELAAVERAIQRLPSQCQSVLFGLRINDLTRDEVALRLGLSLRRVDTVLRQTLDYCAQHSNQQVLAGRRGPRRALSLTRLRV
jgi:RNA polymerase sigma factor (sigma-70 family)